MGWDVASGIGQDHPSRWGAREGTYRFGRGRQSAAAVVEAGMPRVIALNSSITVNC
jgi:hypothetical protein